MTTPYNLSHEIDIILRVYAENTTEELDEIAKQVAQDGVDKLKETSPERTGEYAKNWDLKKVGKDYVIYNKETYQLTHLLEKGHAKRNGGRTKKFVHIKPVERSVIENFEAKVRSTL